MNFEFSNFDSFQYPLIYQGIEFITVENFFQAMKAPKDDYDTRRRISILPPGQARKAGRRIKLRNDWEEIKMRVMMYGLRYKFSPYTSWADKLLATGNTEIVEWNTWHDRYWGKCRCDRCSGGGENHLGRQLMEIRGQLAVDAQRRITTNTIANLAQILRQYPDHSAHSALNSEYAQHWLYCGWANKRLGLTTSPLANPFSCRANARQERIKVKSRDEAVERYRAWLWAQIRGKNKEVVEALISVEPCTTLVCWCAPKRCHCEVIAAAVKWLWTSDTGIDIIFS